VGECASPNPVGFLCLDSVGEALNFQRAFVAQGFGDTDGILPRLFLGEVLGEEDFWNVLTWGSTVFVDGAGELAVGLMSVVAHNLILKEDSDGS
jgi:hypothetical protein